MIQLDKEAFVVRLQYGSKEVLILNRCPTFQGHPMNEWTKDFVQSQKKDMSTYSDVVLRKRIQIV